MEDLLCLCFYDTYCVFSDGSDFFRLGHQISTNIHKINLKFLGYPPHKMSGYPPHKMSICHLINITIKFADGFQKVIHHRSSMEGHKLKHV